MTPRFQGLIWSLGIVGLYLLLVSESGNAPDNYTGLPPSVARSPASPLRMIVRRRAPRPAGAAVGSQSTEHEVVIMTEPGTDDAKYRERYTEALADVGYTTSYAPMPRGQWEEADTLYRAPARDDKALSDYYHKYGIMGTANPTQQMRAGPIPFGPVQYPVGNILGPSHPAPPVARDFEKSFLDHQDDLL